VSLGGILGLLGEDPAAFLRRPRVLLRAPDEAGFDGNATVGAGETLLIEERISRSATEIEVQIGLRLAARKAKNWPESDRIRKELAADGVILEDKPDGTTTWRRA